MSQSNSPTKRRSSHDGEDKITDGYHHQSADEEEDELDIYMASLEKEATKQDKISNKPRKRARINADDSDSSDEDEELIKIADGAEPVGDKKVEDLKADLAAVMANVNAPSNKTTKKLNQLSERKVSYIPFRKDFYVEVPELSRLTEDDVKELRVSLENIKVVGKSCPKPVTCWAHCGLSRKVMDVLKKLKFQMPTPIQAQAIPAIMSGRDVIGIAKTGCGKTLSFLLPMFRHIADQPKLERGQGPIGLVITPTRELATQICDDAQKFTKSLGMRVAAIYGGPNISRQIASLKTGAEIVVCTPGRMIEILTVNSGRVMNLDRCTFLVMDEADRLFDMGFEKQIRSIVDLIRPDRQTVMFSATFPKIMEAHARRILNKPIEIQVGGRSVVCKDVMQHVRIVEEDYKFPALLSVLEKHVDDKTSAIVFVSKQEKADSLLEDLIKEYDPNCLVLHGGIDRDDRISTFASFKGGHTKVLVATSVAARGLDVKNCICVVNYDVPNHYEDYVHRCGRTGRAGNKGYAYTFITPDQGHFANDIIKAFELSGNDVPNEIQELWDNYKLEAERLGKKIWQSSGFTGRGFKFDEAEAQLVNEKKKHQKKTLGMQNSDDEFEDDNTTKTVDMSKSADMDSAAIESEIKSLAGHKTQISKPVITRFGSSSALGSQATQQNQHHHQQQQQQQPQQKQLEPVTATNQTSSATSAVSAQAASKREAAIQKAALVAQKLNQKKLGDLPMASGNSSISSQAKSIVTSISEQIAEQKAQTHRVKLNPALASTSSGVDAVGSPEVLPREPAKPSNQRLEMKFEINDYAQQVRRRLTSKDALFKVSEHCEVGITVKGKFCPPGDRPLEPKLYLSIEGTSQQALELAYKDLLLLVKDEYERINFAPAGRGRFKIV